MDYGVGVKNRFEFLEDDVEDLSQVEDTSADKNPAKKTEKASAQVQPKPAKKVRTGPVVEVQKDFKNESSFEGSSRGRGSTGSARGGRGSSRGGGRGGYEGQSQDRGDEGGFVVSSRGSRSTRGSSRGGNRFSEDRNKENQEEVQVSSRGNRSSRGATGRSSEEMTNSKDNYFDSAEDMNDNEPRGGDRNRQRSGSMEFFGRGRGPRGGRGGGFTRRRDHDRHSGSDRSGVKSLDKRDGSGAHNWGTYRDEMENDSENQPGFVAPDDDTHAENGQGDADLNTKDSTAEGEGTEMHVGVEEIEPELELITLEQWKAKQPPRSTPTYNIRKPNEGDDPSKWNNLVLKKKEVLNEEDEYEEGEVGAFPQRAGRLKKLTDTGFRFSEDGREGERGFRRGARNARGGERSSRGMPFRQERQLSGGNRTAEVNPPKFDDDNAFPTLGFY